METLEDVLSNDEPVEETVEEVAETEESTDVNEPEEQAEDSPSESGKAEDKHVPLAALLDERDKRQKFEQELRDRDARIAELTKAPEKERPSVFDDEEGALGHVTETLKADMTDRLFRISRANVKRLKDDYDDKEKVFMELAKDQPSLRQELLNSDDPAWFAYETASKHERLQELENVDEFREKIRAEEREKLREEIKAELAGEAQKEADKREAITPSLAKKRSTSGLETVEEDDLDAVLTGM